MNNESIQLIAAAIVTIGQIYMIQPWRFPVLAMIWDYIASICYLLGRLFDNISIHARLNYFEAISSGI